MKRGTKKFLKIIILIVILLLVSFFIYSNLKGGKADTNPSSVAEEQPPVDTNPPPIVEQPPAIKYFSPGSDKITISALNKTLYTKKPTTTIIYSATDSSGQLVHFVPSDRAFVRILGVTRLYTNNIEIFHPEKSGSTDDTLFAGNITIPLPGKYLIKVCVGPSINLDSNGTLTWPFGCYDPDTSEVIDVYQK